MTCFSDGVICHCVTFLMARPFRELSHAATFFMIPSGNGRNEPNQFPKLPKPERPATSFLWITSPWKSFRYILWRNYKVRHGIDADASSYLLWLG
jgi:hypothetical protein